MNISIVICAFNSENRIQAALNGVSSQKFGEPVMWETIVVDNGSTDGTLHQVRAFADQNPHLRISCIREGCPGLQAARHAGIRAARGDLIIFVDDDNELDPSYMATALRLMDRWPSAGVIGGCGILASDSEVPDWFPLVAKSYALGSQPTRDGRRNYVYGAGMVLRRSAWEKILSLGYKSLLTDRVGASLSCGGDVEICAAMRIAGFEVYASDELVFRHHIGAGRMRLSYYARLLNGSGDAGAILSMWHAAAAKHEWTLIRVWGSIALNVLGALPYTIIACVHMRLIGLPRGGHWHSQARQKRKVLVATFFGSQFAAASAIIRYTKRARRNSRL